MTRLRARLALSSLVGLAACASACDDHVDTRAYDIARPPVTLHAVGASVSRALFARWAEQYALVDPSTTLVYDPAGSGAGVKTALAGSSDFSVSDTPLSDADAKANRQVLDVPVAVEAIAIVYSLAAAGTARLQASEDVLADLFTGAVKYWDDPALAALNPGVKLPHLAVRPLYRGDASGSSAIVSDWLGQTSKRWLGGGKPMYLPGGLPVQKEAGMIARIQGSDGSLGYLSAVAAQAAHLSILAVPNATGRFVTPTLEGLRAAASTADLGAGLRTRLVAAPGDLSYPLCAFTYVLVRSDRPDPAARTATARFLWWATHDGQAFAPALGFGALPGPVQLRDESALRSLPLGKDREL